MTSGGHREKTKTKDFSEAMKWISNVEPDSWSWTAEESSLGSGSEFSPGSGAIWEARNKQTQTAFFVCKLTGGFSRLRVSLSLSALLPCLLTAQGWALCFLLCALHTGASQHHTHASHMLHTCLTCLTLALHIHSSHASHMPHKCLTHTLHTCITQASHMPHTHASYMPYTHILHMHSPFTHSPPPLLSLSGLPPVPVFYWHSKSR